MRILKIRHSATHELIAAAGFTGQDRFDWIHNTAAEAFGCEPDQIETNDDNEIIVRGEIVAYID